MNIKENVHRVTLALGLQRKIAGVKFYFEDEAISGCGVEQFAGKYSFCQMVNAACNGEHYLYKKNNFGCRCAVEALGLDQEYQCVVSGERYYACQLYESLAVAKKTQRDVLRIDHHCLAIEVGPLEEMKDADIAIIFCDCYQMMRLIQGYTYKFAVAQNIRMAGNQGVCSDLAARPLMMNDLNVSLLCSGTRRRCQWGDGELGAGMPIQLFDSVVEGVIQTLNLTEYKEGKDAVLARLSKPDELGIIIDYDIHYGKTAAKYVRPRTPGGKPCSK